MKLLEKLTNGSEIEINYTGTSIYYKPGVITGGPVEHDCGTVKSIGYFLQPLIPLLPFAKNPVRFALDGVTNDNQDASIDYLRTSYVPVMKMFGVEHFDIKVVRRGALPNGGGHILVSCSTVRSLKPIEFVDEGRIRKIRGVAYSTRISPQVSNRCIESAKSLLNHFIPDVFIYSDTFRGKEAGNSAGYGLSLLAETTTNVTYSTEIVAEAGQVPEELGLKAAKHLYHEISLGGCIDSKTQCVCLLLMALCPEDVSRVRFGKLSKQSIHCLRDLKEFFGIKFKVKADESNQTTILSCIGSGQINFSKKTT